MANTLLDRDSAEKVQLGMGELFGCFQSGTNTPEAEQYWAFLEVQDGTTITSLKFKYDRSGDVETVTRYNIEHIGITLIPPVYNGKAGQWVEVGLSSGQINVYGKDPIG
jgi:hypothetical protein